MRGPLDRLDCTFLGRYALNQLSLPSDLPGGTSRVNTHEVWVLCSCPNIAACATELYVSDVRILIAELERTRATLTKPMEAHGER